MKDTNNPSFKIRFYDASAIVTLAESANQLRHWKDTIEVIMDSNKKASQTNSNSISDELTKLNDLKEKGTLTEEEFQQQKKK